MSSIYDFNTQLERIKGEYHLFKNDPKVSLENLNTLACKTENLLQEIVTELHINKNDTESLRERLQLIRITAHLGEQILALKMKIKTSL